MALGAMASNPDLQLKIVPVGLSYFHAHKFRSRAVVEFGAPLDIPAELVSQFSQGGKDKRAACGQLLDIIYEALKTVTLRTPDFETLMVRLFSSGEGSFLVRAGARLTDRASYRPPPLGPSTSPAGHPSCPPAV
jgi:hypothetical protein